MSIKLADHKNWFKDFPPGSKIYKSGETYTVDRAGIDFIIIVKQSDGSKIRLTRNSYEPLEYFDQKD